MTGKLAGGAESSTRAEMGSDAVLLKQLTQRAYLDSRVSVSRSANRPIAAATYKSWLRYRDRKLQSDTKYLERRFAMSYADIEGAVSLVIAVAGHRDLFEEDEEEIRSSSRSFLLLQRQDCPDNPLILVTGMAEGADCLAVEAARQMNPPVPYIAVLPFEGPAYYATFSSPEKVELSKRLTEGAKYTIALPRVKGNEEADLFESAEARDLQFEALATFLVQASQILLAVYDNSPTSLKGGTSDIIASKLGRKQNPGLDDCSGLNSSGIGPVHCVLVRRKRSGERKPVSTRKQTDYPALSPGATETAYKGCYLLQNEFNRCVAEAKAGDKDVSGSRASLCPSIETTSHPSPAMKWTADHFAWADYLAMQNQHAAERHWNMVFLLLAAGLAVFVPLHAIPPFDHSVLLECAYYSAVVSAFMRGWREHRVSEEARRLSRLSGSFARTTLLACRRDSRSRSGVLP